MTEPIVAVTVSTETVSWAIWRDVPVAVLPWNYVVKLRAAGGIPMLVPSEPQAAETLVAMADALLLTGGPDIDPSTYRATKAAQTLPSDLRRDAAELAAFEVAQQRGIPVLGICRGLQIMAVARGGTLHQHLPEHSPKVPGRYDPVEITIKPDSRLGAAVGTRATVFCHHHQGVDSLGLGLVATAWADDGVIEAAEDPTAPFLVGLQAHPEEGGDTDNLFRAFVKAAN